MSEDQDQPLSPAEREAWREQRKKATERRAMRRAWGHLLAWIGAGFIALQAVVVTVKGLWEWLHGR